MHKILIVSETPEIGTQVQAKLSGANYFTALVVGAEAMVEFCKQHSPDLILLDVDMPTPNLWPSVHAIRAIRNLANLPFVGLSNTGPEETLKLAREYGFCGLMPKTIDAPTFNASIQSIMIETTQSDQSAAPTALNRLIELSTEVNSVSDRLKSNIGEFGDDGAELYGYITNSSADISQKLASISDKDLSDKELRHDFRNMIGSVTGFSELILMEPSLSTGSQQGLTRLRECSKEFVELLDTQKAAGN